MNIDECLRVSNSLQYIALQVLCLDDVSSTSLPLCFKQLSELTISNNSTWVELKVISEYILSSCVPRSPGSHRVRIPPLESIFVKYEYVRDSISRINLIQISTSSWNCMYQPLPRALEASPTPGLQRVRQDFSLKRVDYWLATIERQLGPLSQRISVRDHVLEDAVHLRRLHAGPEGLNPIIEDRVRQAARYDQCAPELRSRQRHKFCLKSRLTHLKNISLGTSSQPESEESQILNFWFDEEWQKSKE